MLQFMNFPSSVSQSSDENKAKSDKTATTVGGGGVRLCKTIGGPIGSQNKLKLN